MNEGDENKWYCSLDGLYVLRSSGYSRFARRNMCKDGAVATITAIYGIYSKQSDYAGDADDWATYQLTISNTAANRVQLGELPAAMVQYFLHPLEFGGQFPFIRMDTVEFAQNGRYVYVTEGFGALCFWCIPAALLLLCFLKISREEKQFCMLGYAAAVLTAFLDHCMGGYNTRYLCDILPVLAVCSVLLLLQGAQSLRKHRAASRAVVLLFLQAPLLLTAVFLSLGENSSMWYGHPDFYFILRDCLVFWQ